MSDGEVFHEKQRLELCAIHALNNVLQERVFTKETADDICKRLAPQCVVNPHRSVLGTGNYDVNVIMAALQSRDLAAVWWDKRRTVHSLCVSKVQGFIPQRAVKGVSGDRVAPAATAALAGGPAGSRPVLQPGLQTEEPRVYRGRARAALVPGRAAVSGRGRDAAGGPAGGEVFVCFF
ncbi:unnamed protein product [Tetraodon nigroviridis]|uniref:ubiquitinyl hydrolase 1 n=1 Tax=Tetraodon nigroviridis TaxID=99883 RepID=Q4SN73_TETNG|nr:unnamed protein product [Tetraodon nigroviridis]